MSHSILVTGAAGFIGSVLCQTLERAGHDVRRALRRSGDAVSPPLPKQPIAVGEIGPDTDWRAAMSGITCVVHLAARTHVLHETASDPLAECRRINVAGSVQLARAAAAAGVSRLVYLSSIKVNGEATREQPFTEQSPAQPGDAYGISKWEAEQALHDIAAATGLELVVLRPPLVYGPGVKGNFLALMKAVQRGLPLPLASVHNRRSLIYVGNLADAILTCVESPAAPGNTYLVSDGEDVSTPELLRLLAAALDVPARLLPCPPGLLRFGGALCGKGDAIARLTGSLQIDSAKIRRELGWQPRLSLASGLEQTARWYLNTLHGKQ